MIKPFTLQLEEVSEKIGVPVSTLRQWIKEEKIRATKPGKKVLVYWTSVEDYLKKSEYKTA